MDPTTLLASVVSACIEIARRFDNIAGLRDDSLELKRKLEQVASVLQRAFDGIDISHADFVEDTLLEVKFSIEKLQVVVRKAADKTRIALFFKADSLIAKLKDCMVDLQTSLSTLTAALTTHNVGIAQQNLDELRALKDGVAKVELANLKLLEGQAALLQHKAKQLVANTKTTAADTGVRLASILQEHLPDDLRVLLHDKQELQAAIKEIQAQADEYARLKHAQEQLYLAQIIDALCFNTMEGTSSKMSQAPPSTSATSKPEIPKGFLCPITMQVMSDPVMTKAGTTYDRDAISKWLETSNLDPLTREVMVSNELFPNRALRDSIQEWSIRVVHESTACGAASHQASGIRQVTAHSQTPLKPYPTTNFTQQCHTAGNPTKAVIVYEIPRHTEGPFKDELKPIPSVLYALRKGIQSSVSFVSDSGVAYEEKRTTYNVSRLTWKEACEWEAIANLHAEYPEYCNNNNISCMLIRLLRDLVIWHACGEYHGNVSGTTVRYDHCEKFVKLVLEGSSNSTFREYDIDEALVGDGRIEALQAKDLQLLATLLIRLAGATDIAGMIEREYEQEMITALQHCLDGKHSAREIFDALVNRPRIDSVSISDDHVHEAELAAHSLPASGKSSRTIGKPNAYCAAPTKKGKIIAALKQICKSFYQ